MRVSIGGDHAGPALKKVLTAHLESQGVEVINRGTDSLESVDYPDHAHAVSEDVANGVVDFGILICGSANGVAMTANKHQSVRAGLAWSSEVAKLVKQHNNANVLCIPARFVTETEGLDILKAFMEEEFEGGRHERRVNKIACAAVMCLLSLIPSVQAWAQMSDPQPFASTILAEDLENHLTVLASDAFEGRETGERGAEKAAAYIASHFNSIGIAPYDGSTYYQPVNLIRSQISGGQASVKGDELAFLDDFLFYPGLKVSTLEDVAMVAVSGAEGIAASDVKGKAVVVAGTDGLNDVREAANTNGAAAVIVVSDDISTLRSRMKPWLMRKSLRLDRDEPREREGTRIPTFMVDAMATTDWWSASDVKSWKKWSKKLAKGKAPDAVELVDATWNFSLERKEEAIVGQNVLGYIPGSDSLLREELIVITAHYDHVGIIDGEIHNGADDDGSGTVSVLELAEAFQESVKAGKGPKRSVLLMTVVGEEKGMQTTQFGHWNKRLPI
jgi:ribose 5-phosphate isomerase B